MKIWMKKGLLLLTLTPFFGALGFLAGVAYLIYSALARGAEYVPEEGGSGVFYGVTLVVGAVVPEVFGFGVQTLEPWMLGGAVVFFMALISYDIRQKRMAEAAWESDVEWRKRNKTLF